ncbi:MAG: hypothetical protein RO009_11060 [Pseudorhodoplanes sp.]|nr:hypothetical protein [Pseudorhodoplanes sp.]
MTPEQTVEQLRTALNVARDLYLSRGTLPSDGHHYVDGFADTPQAEARAFLAAHPDLYEERDGIVRLIIRDGKISTGSLRQAGFASGVDPAKVGVIRHNDTQMKEEART